MSDMNQSEIERLTPQKLLVGFSKGRVFLWILVAAVIHVVVIGGLSTRYIYYTWINPDALVELKAREAAAEKAKDAEKVVSVTKPAPAGGVEVAPRPADQGDSGAVGDKALLEKHANSVTVRQITEVAKPSEIPRQPTLEEVGISLDDTN